MFARLTALLFLGTFACRGEPVTPAIDRVKVHAAASSAAASSAAAQPVSPSAQAEPETAPERAHAPEPPPWPPAGTGATSDFCIDGVGVLDESCCYALPDAPTQELLIYLHGTVPPTLTSPQKTNFQTVVSRASRRAGIAALMPRGRQGLAPKGQTAWWGWPTSGEQYRALARQLIAEFADKRQKLEALTSHPFTRLYLAGSSSGAYFVVALALRGDLPAHGFAAISGGAVRPGHDFTGLTPAPFYVGYGTFDTVSTASRSLAAQLRGAGWPVLLSAHPLPHGTAEIYLDEAFAFFRLPGGVAHVMLGPER
jgi:predicted esterase